MIYFSSINERIMQLVDFKANKNQKKFAEMINFAPQVISNIVSGRKSKPSFDVLNAILSSFVDIDANWLITGQGEMLKTNILAEPNNDCNHYKELAEERAYTIQVQKQVIENLQQELKQHKKTTQSTIPDVLHQSTR